MFSKINIHLIVLVVSHFIVLTLAAPNDGKYRPVADGKYRPSSDGKYRPATDGKYRPEDAGKYNSQGNDGRYKPNKIWKYMHTDDLRHLGKYVHVHIPYNGGYGPYSHIHNPYAHLDNPYQHDFDPTGDYSFVQTVSNEKDPFKNDVYYINTPDIYEAYGIPNPSSDYTASASNPVQSIQILPPNDFQLNYKDYIEKIQLTNNDNDNDNDNNASNNDKINSNSNIDSSIPSFKTQKDQNKQKPFDFNHSQSTSSYNKDDLEQINRRTYHDEGGWKIIRQEGDMNKKKYDFLYETENGIYAEEHAKLNKKPNGRMPTNSGNVNNNNDDDDNQGTEIDSGYYEYTGDDGKLYRVDYSAGENGFQPMGDHIPTPPPVPREIQRLLAYLKEQNKL